MELALHSCLRKVDQVGSEDKILSLVGKQLGRRPYFVKIVLKVQALRKFRIKMGIVRLSRKRLRKLEVGVVG